MIDIRQFNIALLGKWIQRLDYEKQILWKEVMYSKYGGWRDLWSQINKCSDSCWWRDLKKVWSLNEWKKQVRGKFFLGG